LGGPFDSPTSAHLLLRICKVPSYTSLQIKGELGMFRNFATMVSPPKGTTPSNQLDGNKDPSNQQSKSDSPRDGTFPNAGVVGLSFLVLLADFLFWGYRLGITLGLFALAIFAVAALHRKPQTGVIKPALRFLVRCAISLPRRTYLIICVQKPSGSSGPFHQEDH
jgi:hypothetical protein